MAEDTRRFIEHEMDGRSAVGLKALVELCAMYEQRQGPIKGLGMVGHLLRSVIKTGLESGVFGPDDVARVLGFQGGIEEAERLTDELELSQAEMEEIMAIWDEEQALGHHERS